MLMLIVTLFALITSAQAQDTLGVTRTLSTYFVVAGSDGYTNAPDLPNVSGTSLACSTIVEHLVTTAHTPIEHVLNACGNEFVHDRLLLKFRDLLLHVQAGDTLVVIWLGAGSTDPESGETIWTTSDGAFETRASGDAKRSGHLSNGIAPNDLQGMVATLAPAWTNTLYITNAAQGGTYRNISLVGPHAKTFKGLGEGVFAISPAPGNTVAQSVMQGAITTCIDPRANVNTSPGLDGQEIESCITQQLSASGIATETSGGWGEASTDLVSFPSVNLAAVPSLRAKKPIVLPKIRTSKTTKTFLEIGGVTFTALDGIGLAVVLVNMGEIEHELTTKTFTVDDSEYVYGRAEEYERLGNTIPWLGVGMGVGVALATTGFVAIPIKTSHEVSVVVHPSGVSATVKF